ncbi:mitochondrial intermediate peptidase [Cimex lectularius]|uniref:Peptidase M3A/M3B catalytic domain-containing protein n=1 Tax=Cimex lectularius TaxID=79782 RepID=A0A8I6S970_CIMLE|nr:mitochondrial intermediate peptidase [Cimex lectularius]
MFWFWSKTGFSRNFLLKGAIICQRSSIGTWSPLATAFNTRPSTKLSLSFSNEKSGLFRKSELKTYDGFFLLKENVIAATDILVQETLDSKRTRKMVDIFDELSDTLCGVADLAEFVRLAHPQPQFSYAAENACIALSGLVEKLNTNRELYNALRDTVTNGDKMPTTTVDDHVASLFLFDFEQCGIHLSEESRKKVVTLNDYILQLGQRFMSGAVNSRAVKMDLVPNHIRNLFSSENGDLVVGGLYTDAENEVAREVAYKVFLSPDKEQEYLLDELLISRYKLAQLCGFSTYSHRALKSSLAESPSNVWEFLVSLSDNLRTRVDEDFSFMLKIKKEVNPSATSLSAWDIPFITQKAKRNWLKAENSQFSPYFSLGTCMDGLNNLMESLYGISFAIENTAVGETWAPDIYKLAVVHKDEGLLGHIYCDFYERENKPNQDCHFTIRGGKKLTNGSYQNPIVVVMLNVPSPKWNLPSLLTPAMVDNLFHEMGHAMHSMLARTDHQHVTGTRCTMDFAEVPSVLMEYFASDPRVLRTFAKHYETQEPMPEDMIHKLCDSKHVFGASDMQLQVFYSLLDQRYHGPHPLSGTTTEVLADTHNEYYGIPYVPHTAWQLRFSHLVGYGAKYYSYLMSRAVASLIWQNLFEENPFSSSQGERYRRECLAHGGGKPPHSLIKDFLQFDPTPQTLATALINDLDRHKVL